MFDGVKSRKPGYRLVTNRLLERLGSGAAHIAYPRRPCFHCGGDQADFYPVHLRPDFDLSILPTAIRRLFAERAVGVCRGCGIVQDFNRMTRDEIFEFCNVLVDKDKSVSEEAFHTYPVPETFIQEFHQRFHGRRLEKYEQYLPAVKPEARRILVLRPFFGAVPKFFSEFYGPNVELCGLEISGNAQKTVEDRLPDFRFLDGNIHGYFEGAWLDSGPYDIVFCMHTLVHCIDPHDSLQKLKSLLTPDGLIIFQHEISFKVQNPFHVSFWNEDGFLDVLGRHLSRIDRLDACEADPPAHVRALTRKGDSADFIARMD